MIDSVFFHRLLKLSAKKAFRQLRSKILQRFLTINCVIELIETGDICSCSDDFVRIEKTIENISFGIVLIKNTKYKLLSSFVTYKKSNLP